MADSVVSSSAGAGGGRADFGRDVLGRSSDSESSCFGAVGGRPDFGRDDWGRSRGGSGGSGGSGDGDSDCSKVVTVSVDVRRSSSSKVTLLRLAKAVCLRREVSSELP